MDKRKYFFERGNARVSWDAAPEDAMWLCVDYNGMGRWWSEEPHPGLLLNWIDGAGEARPVHPVACAVGSRCDDWKSLKFKRPDEEE